MKNFIQIIFRSVLALVLVVVFTSSFQAADESYSQVVYGRDISTSVLIDHSDPMYATMVSNPSTWSSMFTNYSVSNVIDLKLDREKLLNAPNFTYSVIFNVTYKKADFSTVNRTDTLTVTYDATASTTHIDEDAITFTGGHSVKVEVTSITNTTGTDAVILESTINVERYYAFDYTNSAISGIGAHLNSEGDVEFYWPAFSGAEEYDLEWVFINNYGATGTSRPSSELTYDFNHNSTRISTPANYWKISNVFEQGYVLYRVRPVGRKGTNFTTRYEGKWSSTLSSGSVSGYSDTLLISSALESDKFNWVYQAGYAENGKKTETIAYMDGLGVNRQSQAKNNTENKAIVQESYLDYSGRPAVTALPAPDTTNLLDYKTKFNKNYAGDHYSRSDFDKDTTFCGNTTHPMDTTSGAGMYYSSNNPDQADYQAYVPNANGYPLMRVEYLPDNTGRIKSQRIAGALDTTGAGITTKFRYGTPTQSQVSGILGTDAGYSNKYQRNLVEDPNGQVSATYVDLSGRVVASSLIGASPQGIDSLASNTGPYAASDTILSGLDNQTYSANGYSIDYNQTFSVDVNGIRSFNYSFTPGQYSDTCFMANVCFDCSYDLHIEINRVDYDSICFGDSAQVFEYNTTINDTLNDSCSSITDFLLDSANFNVYLEKGEYVIRKVLTVREAALTYYTQSFLQYDTCLMTYQDFYNAELANADFTGCNLTQEGEGCLAVLGTRMDYILNHPAVANAGAVYDSLFAACEDTSSASYYPCTAYRNAMLADFYPGGQYAQYEVDTNGVYSSSDTLSIFNSSNYLGIYFQNSGIIYTDPIGDTSFILNQYDSLVYPTDTSISLEVFIQNFQTSWTDSLLRYHPEYCYLEYCENGDGKGDNVTAVYNYDAGFLDEQYYSGADTNGYFNPLNMTTGEGVPSIWVPSSTTDPFFSSSSGSGFLNNAKNMMTSFTVIYGDTLTIWEAAYWMTSCSASDSVGLPSCISNLSSISTDYCIQDAYWRNFRELYWSVQQKYYSKASANYAIEHGCYNGCIGTIDFDTTLNSFDCYPIIQTPHCTTGEYYRAYGDTAQPCYYATSGLYSDKVSHFPNNFTNPFSGLTWNQIADTVNIMIDSVLSSTCDTVCSYKAKGWMDMLVGCAVSPTTWQPGNTVYDSMLYELTELCVLGCQASGTGGTLTLPIGTTTHNGNRSMDEILSYHLSSGWETYECTSLLISDATNYDDSLYLHQYDTLDACGCNAFMSIRNSFDSIVLPPNVNTLEDLFFLTYSISIPNLQPYLCTCDAAWSYNTGAWHEGATWNTQSQDSLNASGISIPLDLTCVECKTCAQIEALNTSLLARISNVDTTENYERILGNYINRNTHFNLTGEDYANFLSTCGGDTTNVVFCKNTREGEDFIALLNNLLHVDEFLTTGSAYANLTGNPYYYNSILPQVHNDISFVQYSSDYGTNDTLITLTIGNGTSSCTTTLWFPSNSGYNLQWHYLGGLQNLRPNESTCGVTSSGEFLVDGLFYVGGQELVITLTGTSGCYTMGDCSCNHLEICNDVDRVLYEPNACIDQIYQSIADQSAASYGSYMENEIAQFQQSYIDKCMTAVPTELLTMNYSAREYHYTLFYYDQAGNLVQTVPPKGVEADSTFNAALVLSHLGANTTYTPSYRLKTQYRYNSFNQLTRQNTPDGGETRYWYDYSGRIAASQNAKQADSSYYSYTKYDTYGRIIEAGQVKQAVADSLTESIVKNSSSLENWINGGTRYEVTRSYYDESLSVTIAAKFDNGQNNLRLRIGTVAYYDTYSGTDTVYNHATHYSYDRHGNVTEVIQDFPDFDYMNQSDKHTQYEYELISGNVTRVDYQKDRVDAYSHRYEYDADNRLDKVYTSEQGTIWDQDAHYHYYAHGPLARTEIGDWEVQGTDYAYTINGWLKAVNGNILDADTEMGTDGSNSTPYHSSLTAAHNLFGKDAYGFSLGYYSDGYEDYSPAKSSRNGFYNSLSSISTSGSGFTNNLGSNLYNGNIRHIATALLDNNEAEINKIANFYTYDQLNRITKMKSYLGSTYATASSTGDYNTAYSYDANGNLKTLLRNAHGTHQSMDNFTYHYADEWNNNQLDYVHDPIDSTFWNVDIDNQSSGNYAYSPIGELIRDDSAYITQIQWRWSDSKVSKIKRTNSKDQVTFKYDAFGNRVAKLVKPTDAYGNTLSADQWTISIYARDAAGNVMAVYDYSLGASAYTLIEKEVTLYGSSRLGVKSKTQTVATYSTSTHSITTNTQGYPERDMGNKYYELSNHLGNVLSVITDRKLANDEYSYSLGSGDYSYDATLPVKYYYTPGTGSYVQTVATDGTNDNYLPDVETYSDYYPFGMEMPGRNGNTSGYRYGFNGMEKDDEVKGGGSSYTTPFRQYDPRLGRWMTTDPITQPWQSPYCAFDDNPIYFADPSGLKAGNGDDDGEGEPVGGYVPHEQTTYGTDSEGDFQIEVKRGESSKTSYTEYNLAAYNNYWDNYDRYNTLFKGGNLWGPKRSSDYILPITTSSTLAPSLNWTDFENELNDFIDYYNRYEVHWGMDEKGNGYWYTTERSHIENLTPSEAYDNWMKTTQGYNDYMEFEMGKWTIISVAASFSGGTVIGGGLATPKSFNFNGIITERFKLYTKLDYLNSPRGENYFTQDRTHAIFAGDTYKRVIFQGHMSPYPNGTYSFSYRGSFRRYELGIRPDGIIIHNNSFSIGAKQPIWWR